ncbi:uncharacterized protein N7477_007593 [Penicillium maclennaniae]|uniref:uncharacterized protein n=1 Tax=Penicillium maclennaniae TaxID=1343394 RepID=UPI00254160E2|nr:uncharacterized protein N7477_007593 [Penicillium maclennaniae]KAJ5665145.1 hypothetical protein N7477_007593 [Penicillium maclennaniae]
MESSRGRSQLGQLYLRYQLAIRNGRGDDPFGLVDYRLLIPELTVSSTTAQRHNSTKHKAQCIIFRLPLISEIGSKDLSHRSGEVIGHTKAGEWIVPGLTHEKLAQDGRKWPTR